MRVVIVQILLSSWTDILRLYLDNLLLAKMQMTLYGLARTHQFLIRNVLRLKELKANLVNKERGALSSPLDFDVPVVVDGGAQ